MTLAGIGLQPWSRVQFPGPGASPFITTDEAMAVPAFARGISLIAGVLMQMPLDVWQGVDRLPRPRLLDAPQVGLSRSIFLADQVEDYLVHGNALQLVVDRGPDGYPTAVVGVPAAWVSVTREPSGDLRYWVGGTELPAQDVIHVRRRRRPGAPWCGVGVVEQHLQTLTKAAAQERYEEKILAEAAVPSVVVITPNADLSKTQAEEAQARWVERYAGSDRKPAVMPAGTSVVPLAWSPADSQLQEARKMSLVDMASILNLDGYWLGAPSASMTYRSPGPMYLNLLRQTISPITEVFAQSWAAAWLPDGLELRFDRSVVLSDDMASTVTWVSQAVQGGLISVDEGREILGLPPAAQAQESDFGVGYGQ